MSTGFFAPIGETSRRKVVLDVLRSHEENDVVTYGELSEALGVDDSDRRIIQKAVHAASKELLSVDKRALEAVPNEGYRIVTAEEHIRLAQKIQRKSTKQLVRGQQVVTKVDYNQMTPEARTLAELMARAFSAQIEFNSRLDVRQRRLADAVEAVSVRQDRSDSEVAALKSRLERLENVVGS